MNGNDHDPQAPGLFYGAVKISSKVQIVISQRVREEFGLRRPGVRFGSRPDRRAQGGTVS